MPTHIALFDIDNTIYDGFSYFELLKKQADEGLIPERTLASAEVSMEKYKTKLQDYETTIVELLDIYARALKDKDYDLVYASTKQFYRDTDKFFPYVSETIKVLHSSHDIALVTGEPQFIAEAVAERFGLGSYYSTQYEVLDGKFTGSVTAYLASRHEKHDAIKHLIQKYGTKNSFAFGDSEGDVEMLRAVEHAVCLNYTDGLRAIAEKELWHTPSIQDVSTLVTKLNSTHI